VSRASLIVALVLFGWPAISAVAQKRPAPAVAATFENVNVCERVTGEMVATTVKGTLLDARPVNISGLASARCVYGIDMGDRRQTFVLWFNPAGDYDGLRKAASGLVKPLTDIGDAAHLTVDSDTKRVIVTAIRRGKVTIQVTGEREEWVRSLATLALSKF
jgi:hypothetical protein